MIAFEIIQPRFFRLQARENTPNSLMYYEFTDMLYPGGNISYNMQVSPDKEIAYSEVPNNRRESQPTLIH